uniref:LarC family nickel insertion protein n=1 Tax=Treponema sp. TaxID=166 RepID=UPI00388F7DE3
MATIRLLPEQIHFHEVGNMDAVADVAGVCLLMDMLAPDRVVVSPVNTGYGHVHCAHGILPVPAPATEYILHGIPAYSGSVEGELCTPTGAALLKYFAGEFSGMPVMRTEKTGYGIGKKKFPVLNCVRAFIGETEDGTDQVLELVCNTDDMTGEELGYAQKILLENGALDVFTSSVGMKKSRPGVMLTCLCRPEDRDRMLGLVFRHTTTIGIRENICRRYVLRREINTVNTPYGDIRVKKSSGYGVTKYKAEYDDLAAAADRNGISVAEAGRSVWQKL